MLVVVPPPCPEFNPTFPCVSPSQLVFFGGLVPGRHSPGEFVSGVFAPLFLFGGFLFYGFPFPGGGFPWVDCFFLGFPQGLPKDRGWIVIPPQSIGHETLAAHTIN